MTPQGMQIDPLVPPPPRIIEDNTHRRVLATPRPKGIHTKHLTVLERFRVRTLYYDATLSKERIRQITGYSSGQIRTAVRARSAAVGRRPGRPKHTSKKGKCEFRAFLLPDNVSLLLSAMGTGLISVFVMHT